MDMPLLTEIADIGKVADGVLPTQDVPGVLSLRLAPANEGVNQSRAEVGGFLDPSLSHPRRARSSADRPFFGIRLQPHRDVQGVVHVRETAGTRGEALGERLQRVVGALLASCEMAGKSKRAGNPLLRKFDTQGVK